MHSSSEWGWAGPPGSEELIVLKVGEAREQRTHSYSREESAVWLGKLDFHPRNRGKEAGAGPDVRSVLDRPVGSWRLLGSGLQRRGKALLVRLGWWEEIKRKASLAGRFG